MSKKGESIIEAINYLDSFYDDLGLLFSNLENLLSGKGYLSIPNAGNTAAFYHNVSNHIGYSRKWTLKNIQRLYLKKDYIESKSQDIDSALICSSSLYKTSIFNFPVLTCGIINWNEKYSVDGIYDKWDCNAICNVVCDKSIWRFKNELKKEDLIYHLIPSEKLSDIKDLSFFFIDLVKIENSAVLETIVTALVEVYSGNDDISIEDDLIIKKIPQKLLDTWDRPIEKDEEE